MFKNSKNLLLVTFLIATLFCLNSCKKEGSDEKLITSKADVSVEGDRIAFSNSKALNATLNDLKNKSVNYLDSWEDSKNFSSLRRDTGVNADLEAFGFPQFYSTFINVKGEYLIGDTIVWYHNGFKHMVPNRDEDLLSKIKINPGISKIKYEAGTTLISQQEMKEESYSRNSAKGKVMQVTLGNGDIDARYQKHFYTDGGSLRGIVFEIQNYVEQGPIGYNSHLITRIKQMWKGGSKWKPAGEAMEKLITNLTYTKGYNNVFNGAYVEVSGTIPSIPASGAQTDGNNLEYVIATTISSNKTTVVRVKGNYHALVVAPGNSQGFWDVAGDW